MNHPAVKVTIILLAGLFFIMFLFFRYEIQTTSEGAIIYKLNRISGDICAQWPSGEIQCSKESSGQAKVSSVAAPTRTPQPNKKPPCAPDKVFTLGELIQPDTFLDCTPNKNQLPN